MIDFCHIACVVSFVCSNHPIWRQLQVWVERE